MGRISRGSLHVVCLLALLLCRGSVRAQTDQLVHALCGKQVALLGENPVHAFGETLAYKVELVHRLVEECHYNALLFESGTYDFLHIEEERRAGRAVTDEAIAAAIGGLWANDEMHSLLPFLRERFVQGKLSLGGLDDQLGAGSWASASMAEDLAGSLAGQDRERCRAVLERHLHWEYTAKAPYGPEDKTKLLDCLLAVDESLMKTGGTDPRTAEHQAMVANFERTLARNFTEDDFKQHAQQVAWFNDRDRSMWQNFTWLYGRMPKHRKVIVWMATVHTARELGMVSGLEGRVPFGSYSAQRFGDSEFVLGFSAFSGEWRFRKQPLQPLSDAPADSLDAQALASSGASIAFVTKRQLRTFGPVASRVLDTKFQTARWDRVLDGLVVIRKERPPHWPGG